MSWHAQLQLDHRVEQSRTVARYRHDGPLRILQSLYPEGDAICHNVLVHPPSGLVGGDTLAISLTVGEQAHALVTTPGASRFYRSEGETALQDTRITLARGARLEWLPLEAICYSGCIAHNRLSLTLAPGAEAMAWDIAALGLPEAGQPFERGELRQHLALPGVWLERGCIDAADARLMNGALGLAGHRCLATLLFASGEDMPRARIDRALDAARECIESHPLRLSAGATSPHPKLVVVRTLAPVVEPAMQLLRQIRAAWREQLWQLPPVAPRIWSM